MNRILLNLTIDLLAAASLLVMIATGYILRFALPPTSNRTHELWEMSRHEWGTLHSWASLVLIVILGIHVALHWDWLFATIHRRFKKTKASPGTRFRAAILTVIALMATGGMFAWAAQTGVRELETPRHPSREPDAPSAIPMERTLTPQAIDFDRDVMPIFEASCIGCHGPKKQKGGFRVDRRKDFFAPGDPAPLIIPGNAGKSHLIPIVSGEVKDMKSAEDHILPPHEIEILKAWIDAGAKWPEEQGTQQKS